MKLRPGSKVLLDTNVVLDIATQRPGWEDSFVACDVALVAGFVPAFCVGATADVAYLLQSSKHKLDPAAANRALNNLGEMFEIIDVQPNDMKEALSSDMTDYEDALLAFAAFRNECRLIVTKNIDDFADSPVDAMTPKEFTEAFKPDNVEYSEIDL